MKVIKVYGVLRKLLGQCRFELDVRTPAQAIKALCVNFPELEQFLQDSEKDGVSYRVTVGKDQASEENVSPLLLPFGRREVFSITPVITGAGGVGKVLAGVALIAIAIVAPVAGLSGAGFVATGGGVTAAGGATFAGALAAAAGNVGVFLVLTGVAELLSPTPQPQDFKEAKSLDSFSFSGIVNVSRQGVPVPIILGRVFTGSVVISAGLDTV